jgi:hypothetical protein
MRKSWWRVAHALNSVRLRFCAPVILWVPRPSLVLRRVGVRGVLRRPGVLFRQIVWRADARFAVLVKSVAA